MSRDNKGRFTKGHRPANIIEDEFTPLKVSPQRRWNLRNPDKMKEVNQRYLNKKKTGGGA